MKISGGVRIAVSHHSIVPPVIQVETRRVRRVFLCVFAVNRLLFRGFI